MAGVWEKMMLLLERDEGKELLLDSTDFPMWLMVALLKCFALAHFFNINTWITYGTIPHIEGRRKSLPWCLVLRVGA